MNRMISKSLDVRLIEVLAVSPFCTREEVGCLGGLDDNIVRNGLERLFRAGKADRVGHIRLRRRRVWRYFLTGTGVLELARQQGIDVDAVLADMPVSREWGRILAQRLDIVEVAYRLAMLAGSSGEPMRWQWRRRGWMDGHLVVGPSRYIAVSRVGSSVPRKTVRSRMGSMVEDSKNGLIRAALLIAPSETDMGWMQRWCAVNAGDAYMWLMTEDLLFQGDIDSRMLSRPSPTGLIHQSIGWLLPKIRPLNEKRLKDTLSTEPRRRVSLPPEQGEVGGKWKADLLPSMLKGAEKALLDVVMDWPLLTSRQSMMLSGLSERACTGAKRRLQREGLLLPVRIQGEGGSRERLCLTDEGLRLVAWRDRTTLSGLKKRWGVETGRDDAQFGLRGAKLRGEVIKRLVRHKMHTEGLYRVAALIADSCRRERRVELSEMMPEHRSGRWLTFGTGEQRRTRGVRPDASGIIKMGKWVSPFLLEYEERAVTPATMEERLRPYRNYYEKLFEYEAGHAIVATLIIYRDPAAASRFVRHCEQRASMGRFFYGSRIPLGVSSIGDIEEYGVFGQSWLIPGSLDAGRLGLKEVLRGVE